MNEIFDAYITEQNVISFISGVLGTMAITNLQKITSFCIKKYKKISCKSHYFEDVLIFNTKFDNYFSTLKQTGYVIDGIGVNDLQSLILHLPKKTSREVGSFINQLTLTHNQCFLYHPQLSTLKNLSIEKREEELKIIIEDYIKIKNKLRKFK